MTGTPFLRAWTAEEYGGAPINWQIVQHPTTGFIYAANNFGVVEYDGAAWRLIEAPNEGRVRTLVIDDRGVVWVGGDDISMLLPDQFGVLHADSQLDRIPLAERSGGSELFSAAFPGGVAFASSERLRVFLHGGDAFTLPAPASILSLHTLAGVLHVTLTTGATLRLEGRSLAPTRIELAPPGTSTTANRRILDAREEADGTWTLLTNRAVLRIRLETQEVERMLPLPEELLSNNQLAAGVLLKDGNFACSTARSGLLVYDTEGRLLRRIDREHGLPGNRIDFMQEDNEGGLWLAMRSGLARVQLDSPFAVHGPAQGLVGSARAVIRHEGRLVVGHNEGLAVADEHGRFQEIPGMQLGASRLLSHAGRLFVTSGSLRELQRDLSLRLLSRQTIAPLIAARADPKLLFAGMGNGVWIDELAGNDLKVIGRVAAVPGPITHLLDSGDGFLWALSPTGDLWRIDFRAGIRLDAPARHFTPADGLRPARRRDEPVLFALGGQVMVGCAQWLLRYDPTSDRLVPETRIDGLNADKLGPTDVSVIDPGDTWLRLGPPTREIGRLVPIADGRWRLDTLPTPALDDLISNGVYADHAANTVWIAGQGGLVSVDLNWRQRAAPPPLRVVLRGIFAADRTAVANPMAPSPPRLPAVYSALRVTFAAPTYSPDYRGNTQTVYRTKLEGLDREWTDWSPAADREFTNLPYRDFVLHVQARDLFGRESAVTAYAFSIAPPAWLTAWAFSGYALLAALVLAGYVRVRTRALQRRNAELTAAVAARTRELHEQNLELVRLHKLELDEKISARLAEEKARLEVLRYQLNPHFLFNALNSVCAQIIREPTAARAMVLRLAEFCRLTLHRPGSDAEIAMTVGQEVKLLTAYLEIEQARLGDLLAVEVRADPAAADIQLPPFLLLPLIENAVKYGAATSPERVAVRLLVDAGPNGSLRVEVANTGKWLEPGAHSAPSHGIGLENFRQRLARYYPGAHEFTIVVADGWVTMRLQLLAPLHENPRADHR